MYKNCIKSILDFFAALVLLVLFFPLIFIVLVALAFYNQGTPFFTQPRPGKHGKIFKLIKFKTMRDVWDENGTPLPDKDRITPMGGWVRKLSLDELPQLINVLKGDMSLVGPRPLLVRYLPLYNETQKRRHKVKPGITGWAQVNGRNAIDWETKFQMDVEYVDKVSFFLDIKILYLTALKVLKREGINAEQNSTMKPFEGNH
jgi:lipopolysaccharide/colanic/teichoic acid biosynthesis glycosyltransferase